nr:hypothetical protein GCM10020093_005880 [Planobispora longispora]
MNLPDKGRDTGELLAEIARMKEADLPVRGGKVTAYVYDTGRPEVHEAAARAYAEMLEVNTLDPTAFPSVVEMERQVVGAVADLLGGGTGIFTSGGTESIMLAVKAARDSRPVAGRPGWSCRSPRTRPSTRPRTIWEWRWTRRRWTR